MGSLTDYAENAVVRHLTMEAAYSPAATVYVAIATADPTDAATGASMNECANLNGYARTAITFAAAANRRITQSGTVTFPQASGSWGTVSHWAIVTSATHGAGNVLAHGAFATPKSVVNGNTPSIANGEIWIEMTANTGLSNYAANGMLDRMFRNQIFTVSANYVGLATTSITDTTTGSTATEPAGANYSRLQVNNSSGAAPRWSAASGSSASNNAAWTMPTPSGSWGTVIQSFVADAATLGNILHYADITDNAVAANDTVRWDTGQYSLSQA